MGLLMLFLINTFLNFSVCIFDIYEQKKILSLSHAYLPSSCK